MTDTTAAVPKIDDRREAAQMLRILMLAVSELQRSAFPQVIVTVGGTFDDPDTVFTCPWCKTPIDRDGGIYNLDLAIRHNDVLFEPVREGGTEGVAEVSQDDGSYDTMCYGMCYVAACCTLPVDLPDGWDESWF